MVALLSGRHAVARRSRIGAASPDATDGNLTSPGTAMPLKLEITSEHKKLLGGDAVREFRGGGGTIGRALENDWILPDPDRFISGRHATIDFRKGAWYLADLSTNGVYVNAENEPLGRGNPRRLFDGDRLRMGDFELVVRIDEGEDIELPPPNESRLPEGLELVPEEPAKSGIQLLDEEEITGDEEFQSTLFGRTARRTQRMVRKPASASVARPPTPQPPRLTDAAAPPRRRTGSGEPTAEQVFAELLRGMGIERADIHPSVDLLEVMHNAGEVLRELVAGISHLLIARANFKGMFKLDQTTVLPRHNNPLKVSESIEDSLRQLLVGREGEYLGPLNSVRDAWRDLRFHHEALIEAMLETFNDLSERFDPVELQDVFDRSLSRKPLMEVLNRLKYWQLYREHYATLVDAGDSPLPRQFGEEFVRTYEKRLAELKRQERDSSAAA